MAAEQIVLIVFFIIVTIMLVAYACYNIHAESKLIDLEIKIWEYQYKKSEMEWKQLFSKNKEDAI